MGSSGPRTELYFVMPLGRKRNSILSCFWAVTWGVPQAADQEQRATAKKWNRHTSKVHSTNNDKKHMACEVWSSRRCVHVECTNLCLS